ncbi:hypothetical protein BF49_2760 [Bradyrhizobium sp.]|nr:hypothetical protein BF49_2760 [Bradyrhizobium sp.]
MTVKLNGEVRSRGAGQGSNAAECFDEDGEQCLIGRGSTIMVAGADG